MARVLAVEHDTVARVVLVDALRGLGHEVVGAADGAAATARAGEEAFAVLVTAATLPDMDGVELARRLLAVKGPFGVVLLVHRGAADVLTRAAAAGIRGPGIVTGRIDPDRLGSAVEAALKAAKPTPRPAPAMPPPEDWSGVEFLGRISGPIARFPPARVLFLAHRVEAGGAMTVTAGGIRWSVALRGGKVVNVSGLPGLLRPLDPAFPEHGDLVSAIGAAVVAGHPAPRAMDAAAETLGDHLGRLVGARGGEVRFDPAAKPPPGSFPLPPPIPRLIAAGLRRARSDTQVLRTWDPLADSGIRVRVPDDSPEVRWGLDATALRVLRLAEKAKDVGDLVARAAGDASRRVEVLRAAELLVLFGLLVVSGGALAEDDPTDNGRDATREDPKLAQLREALAGMDGAAPVDVLELGDRRKITEADVSAAYREVSKRFHPDTFFSSPPVVRALAETCFAKVNAAYEALRLPSGLAEAERMLEARASGDRFVSEKDTASARVAFRKGLALWRNRDWKGADEHFVEAMRLDPRPFPHAFHHAWCGWYAKRIPAAQAVTLLEALNPSEKMRRAEVLYVMGLMLKAEGRTEEAVAKFRESVGLHPENHEAQREVRLHESRTAQKPPPQATALSFLDGLLKRKKG